MFEDEAPKPQTGYRLGEDLAKWSVEDLQRLLDDLAGEAKRVEAEIRRKRGDLTAAESLFKS